MSDPTPDIPNLLKLYESCGPISGGWDRLNENERVRFAQWDGQSADGRKWDENMDDGQAAFPWDGASDSRVHLADEIINDLSDILTESFWRSVARVQGVEASDTERSGYATKLMDWVKGTKLYPDLVREIELHAQYGQTYGVSLLHTGWERELAYKRVPISLDELKSLGPDVEAQLMDLVLDPEREAEAAEFIKTLYQKYVEAKRPPRFDWQPRPLRTARARKIIRELREEGVSEIPMPFLAKDQPRISALKLWEEVFFPPETSDIQKASVIFVKEWFTETDLKATAEVEGWDPGWVEEALKHKGEVSVFPQRQSAAVAELTGMQSVARDDNDEIEVIYAYQRMADEDGVVGIWFTVMHALVGAADGKEARYAKHELLDYPHGNYPFACYRRESPARALVASRGVPQIVSTWQRELKVQHDAVTDQTSLGVVPPIITYNLMGTGFRYGPAVEVPVAAPGREPKMMHIPSSGTAVAFELMDRVERQANRYFGRRDVSVPADVGMVKQQKQVRSFLLSCTEAFQQMFQLLEYFMDPAQFQRVTGSEQPLAGSRQDIAQMHDYVLSFDVQELSPEFALGKLKAISENILTEDSAGVIDRAKLTMIKLRAIDPSLAKELVNSESKASQQLFRKVQTDFAMMFLGNQPEFVENDPTASGQLQFAQQIVQANPRYQQALETDPLFRDLVQKWSKNMGFSVQQERNKQVGRIGVPQ